MILCREQLVFFQALEKKQIRIWSDACDRGIFLTRNNKDAIRENWVELAKSCKAINVWRTDNQSIRTFRLPVEMHKGRVSGYEITLFHFAGRSNEFININIERALWDE